MSLINHVNISKLFFLSWLICCLNVNMLLKWERNTKCFLSWCFVFQINTKGFYFKPALIRLTSLIIINKNIHKNGTSETIKWTPSRISASGRWVCVSFISHNLKRVFIFMQNKLQYLVELDQCRNVHLISCPSKAISLSAFYLLTALNIFAPVFRFKPEVDTG